MARTPRPAAAGHFVILVVAMLVVSLVGALALRTAAPPARGEPDVDPAAAAFGTELAVVAVAGLVILFGFVLLLAYGVWRGVPVAWWISSIMFIVSVLQLGAQGIYEAVQGTPDAFVTLPLAAMSAYGVWLLYRPALRAYCKSRRASPPAEATAP